MIITELSDSHKKTWEGGREEGREEMGWERQYGKMPCGKQIPQLNRNRENSLENPKPQYKL